MEKLDILNFKNLDNKAIVEIKSDRTTTTLKYKDLLKEIIKVDLTIDEFPVPKNSSIAILSKKDFSLIALTLGILEAKFPFCYINESDIRNDLIDYNSRYFFSEKKIGLINFNLLKSLKVCDKEIYFYQLDVYENLHSFNNKNELCYAIKTSGSCGKKKTVHVTYNSIVPNILSLQKICILNTTDVILSMCPVTFDPFIVDLFLTFHVGCTLLLIHDSLRFDPFLFSKNKEISTGCTFLQMTPTLFRQFGIENIQKKILNVDSSLKYLLLGGEAFPQPIEISTWQDWESENRKRIFNIYGVTEISCWATIHEVTEDDLSSERIPIGKALDETRCAFYSPNHHENPEDCIEELLIASSSRVCYIDSKGKDKAREKSDNDGFFVCRTGDLVRKLNGNLYWNGRINDIIKRFGEKIDMNEIERVARASIDSQVVCVFVKKKVVLFYESREESLKEKLTINLNLKLDANKIPDDIRRIDFLPLNEHGKVSKEKLRELYKEIIIRDSAMNVEDIFIDAINKMFHLKLQPTNNLNGGSGDEPDGKRRRENIDSTFYQLGGKSFDALRIAMKIEDKLKNSSNLLPKLLDNQHTIKEVLLFLKDMKNSDNEMKAAIEKKGVPLKKIYKFDLEKCVDSTPALLCVNDSYFISVGSHSHKLININAKTMKIESQIELSDRIECEVAQFNDDCGLVGCYDGILYCFEIITGKIKWKYDSGGMIKSKPLVTSDRLIVIGNYNHEQNIRCIKASVDAIELKWSKMLGKSLGILANILEIDDFSVIVATLSSTIHKIIIESGKEIWRKNLEFPIFSSPAKIPESKKFLVAEVSKQIHCFDYNGNILWTFDEFDGQIFSSFTFINDSIIFGSHDKTLRCLSYNPQKSKEIDLKWKVILQSQIYSTPKVIKLKNREFLLSCATNGYVNLIAHDTGILEYSKKLPGDIFSSPIIFKNSFFVGCRDNFLYGFLLEN